MTRGIHSPAPSLREVQRRLAAGILTGAPDRGATATWLAVPTGVAAGDRFAVYVNGYPARLHDALAEQFPALAHVIGGARFHALVQRYQRGARLGSYNLNCAGAELASFLRRDGLAEELPFTPDLAGLEWAIHQAFHAGEAAPLDPAALAARSADDFTRARLRFQPSVAVVESPWPIHTLWEARDTPREQIDIDLGVSECVLVCRHGLQVACRVIESREAAALRQLLAGTPLGAVTADLAVSGVAAERVSAWFARWMAHGMLAAL